MKAVLEKIPQRQDESFSAFRYGVRRFNCPYHYHPEVELTWIVEGNGQRLIGDHLDRFGAGDVVLMGPGLPHSYFQAPDYDRGPRGAVATVVQFRADFGGGWLERAPECREIVRLLKRSERGLHVGAGSAAKARTSIERLLQSRGAGRIALLLETLSLLSRSRDLTPLATAGFRPAFNGRQGEKIERACAWVAESFQGSVDLVGAARRAHMTPAAFSRFFRRATGRTFTRFVNEVRIGHACRLLLETEQGAAEIAFASGFENLSNFNRRFRELRGVTPTGFRRASTLAFSDAAGLLR